MSQQLITSKPTFIQKKVAIINDLIIAFGWSFFLGLPLFVVHMAFFDFEHNQHNGNVYLFVKSITNAIPHHPISLALWLITIFIAAFAIRRSFQQKLLLIQAHKNLAVSNTQALTDGLTGIWNRYGFEELQIIFMEHAREKNCPFSIILGDVDGLKQYNDKYGHPQADLALKSITQIITAQIRTTDSLARYGGDEFAIFCFDLDQLGAESLIERIKNALKDAPLSMSFGTAVFPVDGQNSKELIQIADSRLYQAKANNQLDGSKFHDPDCQCENCKCNNR